MMVDWDVKAKKAYGDERRVEATNVWLLLPPPREQAATARQVEQGERVGGPVKQSQASINHRHWQGARALQLIHDHQA